MGTISVREWELFFSQHRQPEIVREDLIFDVGNPYLNSEVKLEELESGLRKCAGGKFPGNDGLVLEFF